MSMLIVIPCLNEEAHLPGLLAQLLDENPDARIVVADGGSTDASLRVTTPVPAAISSTRARDRQATRFTRSAAYGSKISGTRYSS